MEFRHLRYFVAVAEELHFRRAAERLHVVQPALSQQISRLEQELGVQLLARSKRSVALTAAGAVFLEDARGLLARREQAIDTARRAAAGHSGRLRVGYIGPAAYSLLYRAVRAHRARYADVDLVLDERPTAEQLDMVAEGALDVGVVRLPVADERLAVERVLVERVLVVLPEDHPMADHAEIDFAQIAREPFIVAPQAREPTIVNLYLGLCLAAGVGPRIVQEAPQIHTVVGLVSAGLGLALVPEAMRNLKRPGVLYRPLRTDATFETALVWRRPDAPPVVEAFRATVRELLADEPAAGAQPTGSSTARAASSPDRTAPSM